MGKLKPPADEGKRSIDNGAAQERSKSRIIRANPILLLFNGAAQERMSTLYIDRVSVSIEILVSRLDPQFFARAVDRRV